MHSNVQLLYLLYCYLPSESTSLLKVPRAGARAREETELKNEELNKNKIRRHKVYEFFVLFNLKKLIYVMSTCMSFFSFPMLAKNVNVCLRFSTLLARVYSPVLKIVA